MRVVIFSPFPLSKSYGNSSTAKRLQKILSEHQLDVIVDEEWYGGHQADCMIALNARRSAGAIEEYQDANPEGRVIIILTGTDINHPDMEDVMSPTRLSMRYADRLVALHECSLEKLPDRLKKKTHVIYPSVSLPVGLVRKKQNANPFNIIVAGNVRAEKNIPLLLKACQMLPENTPLQIQLYGESDEVMQKKLINVTESKFPFLWKGKVKHTELLEKLAHADLLLNTSTQEGGANAICEAISLGVPVLASNISGNIGMLGSDYAGYFESENAESLLSLLENLTKNKTLYQTLEKQVTSRAELFTYTRESSAWLEIMKT